MYPVGLCLHILPDVLWYDYCRFLAEPSRLCLGAFGFYLNITKLAGFRSRKLWNRQAKLYFMGIPIMRAKLAMTAFKMPVGICFPLSASTELLTEASKDPCFYPPRISSGIKSTRLLFFKMQHHCVLKNCINPILQQRSPVGDHRVFCFSLLCKNQCYIPH